MLEVNDKCWKILYILTMLMNVHSVTILLAGKTKDEAVVVVAPIVVGNESAIAGGK